MASVIVLPSKRIQDVQKYTFSFARFLAAEDFITTAEVSISVFSGVDAYPYELIPDPYELFPSQIVQTVRGGLPGVTYEFLVTVTTDQGFVYTSEARLSILPLGAPAGTNYRPFFFSSRPYPISISDEAVYSGEALSGLMKGVIVVTDAQTPSVAAYGVVVTGAAFRDPLLLTILPPEQVTYEVVPVGGELRVVLLSTDTEPSAATYSVTPTGGDMGTFLVSAECQPSASVYSVTPTGGELL